MSGGAPGGGVKLPLVLCIGGLKRPVHLMADGLLHRQRVVTPVVKPVADFQRQATLDARLERDVWRRIPGDLGAALDLFFEFVREPIEGNPRGDFGREREETGGVASAIDDGARIDEGVWCDHLLPLT